MSVLSTFDKILQLTSVIILLIQERAGIQQKFNSDIPFNETEYIQIHRLPP